jgi:hypothetical protein
MCATELPNQEAHSTLQNEIRHESVVPQYLIILASLSLDLSTKLEVHPSRFLLPQPTSHSIELSVCVKHSSKYQPNNLPVAACIENHSLKTVCSESIQPTRNYLCCTYGRSMHWPGIEYTPHTARPAGSGLLLLTTTSSKMKRCTITQPTKQLSPPVSYYCYYYYSLNLKRNAFRALPTLHAPQPTLSHHFLCTRTTTTPVEWPASSAAAAHTGAGPGTPV